MDETWTATTGRGGTRRRCAAVQRCPRHGGELSGGPVVFHCSAGPVGHRVMAADLQEAVAA